MTAVLPDTGPVYDGDPLRPDLEMPAPDEVVAALSPTQRQLRVLALIEQAQQIYIGALVEHTGDRVIVATCLLWSGGNDSNTLAHLMRRHLTHVVHANTGIGLEETRQFVRDTAVAWGLPLIEKHPPVGSTYRDYVLKYGFPGPGQHYRMYQRLKERALRQARKALVRNGRRQRVVFLAGRRRAESKRREDVPVHEREDSVIWVSPMAMWTKLDINTYRTMHDDVPHNDVCDHLHMSGECLCGSFAKPGELDQLRLFYPATVAYIETLQAEAIAAGIPAPRNQWGWGAYRTDDQRGPNPEDQTDTHTGDPPVGRLCSSCTSPFDRSGPETPGGCHMSTPDTRPALQVVPTQPVRRTRWTDTELMREEFPPVRWAVPGLLCEGLNLLAGAPKLGKSWLSLGIGAAIANGDPALGSIDVERGPVLYCALEDTGRRLQRRRRQMLAAGGRAAPLLTMETACPTMTAGGDALIVDWLETNHGARLVIIDTFEKMRGRDAPGASAYAGDYAAATRFKIIADTYSTPILLIHHVRKQAADDWQDLVSGTNGLTGAVDATLVLQRSRGQADGVLHVTGRDVEENDYAMTFDAQSGAWTKLDGAASDYELGETRALLLRLIRDYPGSKPGDLAKALPDVPAPTIRKTLGRMAEKGQVKATPGGAYHPIDQASDSGQDVTAVTPVTPSLHPL
jgi:3'-phosphoadenosine 5'-phosphosulfate sulfotransferase (PAPS reductase)/FAD synthetase